MERLKAMPALEGVPVIVISARDPATEREHLVSAIGKALGHPA